MRVFHRIFFQAVLLPVVAAMSTVPVSAITIVKPGLPLDEGLGAEVFAGTSSGLRNLSIFRGGPQSVESVVRFPGVTFNRPVFSSALPEDTGNLEVGLGNLGALRTSMSARSTYSRGGNSSDEAVSLRFNFFSPSGEIILEPICGPAVSGFSGSSHENA